MRQITRRTLMASPLLVTPLLGATPAPIRRAARPDILIFVLDDADTEDMRTLPTANELIGGQSYEQFVVTEPLCSPSRACIFTGQYAHNTGVRTNGAVWKSTFAPRADQTMFTAVQAAGYHTVYVGKVLGKYQAGDGFPGISANYGESSPNPYFVDGEYITDRNRDRAVGEIASLDPATPLCRMIGFVAPHQPFIPAPRHASASVGPTKDRTKRQRRRTLLAVDEAIAAIRDAMGSRWDNALIMLISDNGYIFPREGRGNQLGKAIWYDEVVRVPARIRLPGDPAIGVNSRLIANIDIAPTVIRAAGADAHVTWPIDGRALQDPVTRDWLLISSRTRPVRRYPGGVTEKPRKKKRHVRAGNVFDGLRGVSTVYVREWRVGRRSKARRNKYFTGGNEHRNRWGALRPAAQQALRTRLAALMTCVGDSCREHDRVA